MNTTKLKAFTLYEMLVAMIVSAIVMGITANVFLIVSKQFNSFRLQTDNEIKIRQLHQILINETAWSNVIYIDQYYKKIIFSNDLKKNIISFDNDVVIFKNDTIAENIIFKGYFENKEIEDGNIEALKLNYISHNIEKQLFYYKDYDAEFYVTLP